MVAIRTVLAHSDTKQMESLKIVTKTQSQGKFMLEVVSSCQSVEELYASIMRYAPTLIITEDTLFTPCINYISAEADIIIASENRALTDQNNIRYTYTPIQPLYIIARLSKLYLGQTDDRIKGKNTSMRKYVDSLHMPGKYSGQVDRYYLEKNSSSEVKLSFYGQRKEIAAAIDSGKIFFNETSMPQEEQAIIEAVPTSGVAQEPLPGPVATSSPKDEILPEYVVNPVVATLAPHERAVTAIMIASPPEKSEYIVGFDSLDLSGGALNITYSDSTVERVPMSEDMNFFVDNMAIGTSVVCIQYMGFETMFHITIRPEELIQLILIALPEKTLYIAGDAFDITGTQLKGIYNTGREEEIQKLPVIDHIVKMGESFVPISINNVSVPVFIEVQEPSIVAIEVETLPNKTEYLVRKDLFDPTGGTFVKVYNNGKREPLLFTEGAITGFDNSVHGSKSLTLSYAELSCDFKVTIMDRTLTKIELATVPKKTSFFVGEYIEMQDVTLKAYFNNGETEITADFSVSPAIAEIGMTEVCLVYCNEPFSTTTQNRIPISISVYTRKAIGVQVLQKPIKNQYVERQDQFDPTGGIITVSYDNGATEDFPMTKDMVMGFHNVELGEIQLTAMYEQCSTQFPVMIIPATLVGLMIRKQPNKTTYHPGEYFDADGLVLSGLYANGETREIHSYDISPMTALSTSNNAVLITFMDKTVIIPIFVSESAPAHSRAAIEIGDVPAPDPAQLPAVTSPVGTEAHLKSVHKSIENNDLEDGVPHITATQNNHHSRKPLRRFYPSSFNLRFESEEVPVS